MTDAKVMNLTRKDLVKSCAAQLLVELEEDRVEATKATAVAKKGFNHAVEAACLKSHRLLIAGVAEGTQGRSERWSFKVCHSLSHLAKMPQFVAVIVQDGTDYDYNFRLQFSVKITGEAEVAAIHVRECMKEEAWLLARCTKVTAMDAKAREKLIGEALDSNPQGQEALAALKRMRAMLKQTL